MIKCQACGTQNLDTSQYCDECGDSLQKYKAPEVAETSVSSPPQQEEKENEQVPVFQSASVTSIGVPPEIEQNESDEIKTQVASRDQSNDAESAETPDDPQQEQVEEEKSLSKSPKGVHSKLIIERGQSIGTEFPLASEESNIGRWDADNGVFPDVDLDAHDTEAKVSRKHARIIYRNGQYFLEDLGSTNGTFVNRGRRLIPGSPHALSDGDEIIVGKTFLRFNILN